MRILFVYPEIIRGVSVFMKPSLLTAYVEAKENMLY